MPVCLKPWKVAIAFLIASTMPCEAADDASMLSNAAFVFLRPETSSFWRTATNSTVSLPVKYPDGATSAELVVGGAGYSRTYANIPEGYFELELPAAEAPEKENVYDLVLSFNDGTMQTAKLGLIQGLKPGAEGATRCLSSMNAAKWGRTRSRAVFPVPYGTGSFEVFLNGEKIAEESGLDGSQGWYALSGMKTGDNVAISASAEDVEMEASLYCRNPNFTVVIK